MSAGAVVRLHRAFLVLFHLKEPWRPKRQPRPVRPTTWTQSIAGCSCASGESKVAANASKVKIFIICVLTSQRHTTNYFKTGTSSFSRKNGLKANANNTKIHRTFSADNVVHCSDRSRILPLTHYAPSTPSLRASTVYAELPKAYDQLFQNGNLIKEINILKCGRKQTKNHRRMLHV